MKNIMMSVLFVLAVSLYANKKEKPEPWSFLRIPQSAWTLDADKMTTIFYSPACYRGQEYRFKVTGSESAKLFIDDKEMKPKKKEANTVYFVVKPYKINGGVNRLTVIANSENCQVEMAHPGDVLFYKTQPDSLNPEFNTNCWNTIKLTNGIIDLEMAEPDPVKGIYRGRRFEQAGLVTKLRYKGHQFFIEQEGKHEPLNHSWGISNICEFRSILGWDDAKPGESVVKVGVGELERYVHEKFAWYEHARIVKLYPWKIVKEGDDSVMFTQTVDGPRGWGYTYRKTAALIPGKAELKIHFYLKNTGEKTIQTEFYCHNWVSIDNANVADAYTVSLNYQPIIVKQKSAGNMRVVKNTITPLTDQTTHTPLQGWESDAVKNNYAHISCKKSEASIILKGNFPTSAQDLFFSKNAICYEPFKEIHLAPGEETSWSLSYQFIVSRNHSDNK